MTSLQIAGGNLNFTGGVIRMELHPSQQHTMAPGAAVMLGRIASGEFAMHPSKAGLTMQRVQMQMYNTHTKFRMTRYQWNAACMTHFTNWLLKPKRKHAAHAHAPVLALGNAPGDEADAPLALENGPMEAPIEVQQGDDPGPEQVVEHEVQQDDGLVPEQIVDQEVQQDHSLVPEQIVEQEEHNHAGESGDDSDSSDDDDSSDDRDDDDSKDSEKDPSENNNEGIEDNWQVLFEQAESARVDAERQVVALEIDKDALEERIESLVSDLSSYEDQVEALEKEIAELRSGAVP
jgi:hypothetical protein